MTLTPPSPFESSNVPVLASRLPSLSTPTPKRVVPTPAVFFSVPPLLNCPVPPRLFRKSLSVWTSKTPLLLKVETPERMSPAPAKFQVPWLSITRPPVRSFTPPPLTFMVTPAARKVVPVPVIVPPDQLDAGLGPLIVKLALPASTPPD